MGHGNETKQVIHINGGRKLSGGLKIGGAKNSILPILSACILTKKTVVLKGCPPLLDIYSMLEIIKSMGGKAEFGNGDITVNCADVVPQRLPEGLTGALRASVFVLGPLLSRFKQAQISFPGGCEIGLRPIDLHLDGLRSLGVNITAAEGMINCDGTGGVRAVNGCGMKSGIVNLSFPSVGATENLMMAAVLLDGITLIKGAAREPEVEDLAEFINALGGRVFGAGTDTVMIEGVKSLGGGDYMPIPDRIAAGTYLAAAAMCGGRIRLDNIRIPHIYSIVRKLEESGCRLKLDSDSIEVVSSGALKAVSKITTAPYPGFPTDMQPQITAMLSIAGGKSEIAEKLFESRFNYIVELNKMGTDIAVNGDTAVVTGVVRRGLKGADVKAHDLRGGAALVVAGLAATGKTTVAGAEFIDRGYYKIENNFAALGADIKRI